MWVVHRDELRRQATDAFDNFAARVGAPQLPALVDVMMASQVQSFLDTHRDARFAVIDEAHHVAAKSYHALFSRTSLGILGLTATPSRPRRTSRCNLTGSLYSIGFPDLGSRGRPSAPERHHGARRHRCPWGHRG